jgi:hypothetical protein
VYASQAARRLRGNRRALGTLRQAATRSLIPRRAWHDTTQPLAEPANVASQSPSTGGNVVTAAMGTRGVAAVSGGVMTQSAAQDNARCTRRRTLMMSHDGHDDEDGDEAALGLRWQVTSGGDGRG